MLSAMVAGAFAADVVARVVMDGALAKKSGDGVALFALDKKDQKDEDALLFQVNGDEAGAYFRAWYNYAGNDGAVTIRDTKLWFKPVSMLKITVGRLNDYATYKEMLHWWKDPVGGSFAEYNSWAAKYGAGIDGNGIGFELTPVDGLNVAVGFEPGVGAAWLDGKAYKELWAQVKYSNIAGLPLSAGVSYNDKGTDAAKIISVGFDYGNPWADGFYAMVNARMRLVDGLAGISIDNYFKFISGALTAQLRAPVTIRTNDDSYMSFSGKVQYAVGAITPYFLFGSDAVRNDGINLKAFGDTFNCTFQPGFTTNVGACSIDLGIRLDYNNKAMDWAIPFECALSF